MLLVFPGSRIGISGRDMYNATQSSVRTILMTQSRLYDAFVDLSIVLYSPLELAMLIMFGRLAHYLSAPSQTPPFTRQAPAVRIRPLPVRPGPPKPRQRRKLDDNRKKTSHLIILQRT